MANTIQLKRSAVAGRVPAIGDLALGEFGINTWDGKVYIKKNDGTDAIVQVGGPVGSNTQVVFNDNGVLAGDAELTYNKTTNTLTTTTFSGALSGNASTATTLQTPRTINGVSFNGSANITVTANTSNSLTFNNGGAGGASGSAFNGGSALTVSYNTIGAPSTTGTNASGTWGISITGNAATVTNGVYTTGDQTIGGTKTFSSPIRPPAAGSTWIGGLRGNSAISIPTVGTVASFHGWISQRTPSGGFALGTLNDTIYFKWATNASIDANTNNTSNVLTIDSAGTVTATTFSGALNGNAATASAWATGSTITLTGDITGTSAAWTGSGNISFSTAIATGSIVNADINASAAIADTKLATISTAGKVSNSATTATSANTANAIVARDANGDIAVTSINNGPLAGFRNAIVNGCFRVAQRGTSFTQVAHATYTLDRWEWQQGSTGVSVTISQTTTVPNDTFSNSLRVDITSADTSIAAADYAMIIQKVEGYNACHLIGKTFTLSFWVRSPKTGTHCIAFRNSGFDRSYIKTYTVNVANTWEYKSVTVAGGLITAGTWNWTNGLGLGISFVLACGSTFQTTADAWQTGDFLATSAQVNCLDNTANDFYITGVQLEEGPVATPFERRPYGTEFGLCMRYYQKNYARNTSTGSEIVYFKVPMRTTPNLTVTTTFGATVSAVGGGYTALDTFRVTSSGAGDFDWTASIEL